MSLAYALAGARWRGEPKGPLMRQVLRRAALLFGLLLSFYPRFDFSVVRMMGELQRIGLVYLGGSLVYLTTSWRTPPPTSGPGSTACSSAKCTSGSSRAPGTLKAFWAGCAAPAKIRGLLAAGGLGGLLGLGWNGWFPINKALWTSSYVFFTGGLALGGLAGLYWLCDVRGYRRWAAPAVAFGVNAIAVFVGSGLLARTFGLFRLSGPGGHTIGLKEWLYEWGIVPLFHDPRQASLAGAVVCLLIWLIVLSLLYRRQWVWKV